LLAASFRRLRDGEPGWITMQEAGKLFSSVGGTDTLGERDKLGIANLVAFAAALGEAQFKFEPEAGRLYFKRRAAGVVRPRERCISLFRPHASRSAPRC